MGKKRKKGIRYNSKLYNPYPGGTKKYHKYYNEHYRKKSKRRKRK